MKKSVNKSFGMLWIAVCVALIGVGVFIFAPACRFSALGFWGLGGVILIYWILERLRSRWPKGIKILRRVFTLCLCVGILMMAVTLGFILNAARGAKENDSPYLLVLGAGVDGTTPSLSLWERLTAAKAYLDAHPETVCIVSGGQGNGEEISEAQCMYDWLTARGIAPERVLMEDQASNTEENLAYSAALLRERGINPQELAVVSSEYHLFRASLMAQKEGIKALGVPARTGLVALRLNYYFREIFGVWYFIVFGL